MPPTLGFEHFFIEMGTDCTDPTAPPPPIPDGERVMATIAKHGMDVPRG